MFNRLCVAAIVSVGLLASLTGCSTSLVDSITVSPTTLNFTGAGLTAQLTATGLYGRVGRQTSKDITDSVTWTTVSPDVATVSATGLVTSVGPGTVQITASMSGFTGVISAYSTVTVTIPNSGGGGSTSPDMVSLAIIPGSQSVASPTQTSQFIAIGTNSSGGTVDLTTKVLWNSSSAQIATILPSGLATGVSQGTTTISAIFTNPDSTVVAGTATFTVAGGASQAITSLTITPTAESLSASGQTGQLIAVGTEGSTGLQKDVTDSVTWISSIPSVATVSSGLAPGQNGIVTGVSAGSVTVTAEYANTGGTVVTPTTPASLTITNTAAPTPLLSLAIIPQAITVNNLQDTGNFLAIGTYSVAPYIRDLTNSVIWLSSEPEYFPVNTNNGGSEGATAGIVTAFASGGAVIIAEATDPTTGSIQTQQAQFNCPLSYSPTTPSCIPGDEASGLLSTVTIYNEGTNTTDWLVTGPSATGTVDVIHCGPGWTGAGGSVCVATYPIGTTVVLTAPAGAGNFGGWSSTCTPIGTVTQAGPNKCQLETTTYSESVGAIFN